MAGFFIRLVVNFIALITVVHVVPGVSVDRIETVVIAALVLGLINAFLRPAVMLVTLPLTIVTLGLFTFFVNGLMFYLASKIVHGFIISNFWSAFWGALVFSFISFMLNLFINPQGKIRMDFRRYDIRRPGRDDFIDAEFKVEDKKDKTGRLQ